METLTPHPEKTVEILILFDLRYYQALPTFSRITEAYFTFFRIAFNSAPKSITQQYHVKYRRFFVFFNFYTGKYAIIIFFRSSTDHHAHCNLKSHQYPRDGIINTTIHKIPVAFFCEFSDFFFNH